MDWNTVLTGAELERHFDKMAKLDPAFAVKQREFYQSRTEAQLKALRAGAWDANEKESYVLANSFLIRELSTKWLDNTE